MTSAPHCSMWTLAALHRRRPAMPRQGAVRHAPHSPPHRNKKKMMKTMHRAATAGITKTTGTGEFPALHREDRHRHRHRLVVEVFHPHGKATTTMTGTALRPNGFGRMQSSMSPTVIGPNRIALALPLGRTDLAPHRMHRTTGRMPRPRGTVHRHRHRSLPHSTASTCTQVARPASIVLSIMLLARFAPDCGGCNAQTACSAQCSSTPQRASLAVHSLATWWTARMGIHHVKSHCAALPSRIFTRRTAVPKCKEAGR